MSLVPKDVPGDLPGDAAAASAARVRAAGGSVRDRYVLAGEFYRRAGRRRYGRAELSFLRWAIARGVLNAPGAARPGSPWWRAVNDRLLRDKLEADALDGRPGGPPTSRSVALWRAFIAAPSAASWYRAHNASIVAGYLDTLPLAADELVAERFLMNVALVRVLYAHALVADPRLALGALAPAGRVLADPRRGSVGFFLDLRRAFPERYPLDEVAGGAGGAGGAGAPGRDRWQVEDLIAAEAPLARLLDYGIIAHRITALYEFAAASLGMPEVASLIEDGAPCYAWPASRRWVWRAGTDGFLLPRLTALVTRPRLAR